MLLEFVEKCIIAAGECSMMCSDASSSSSRRFHCPVEAADVNSDSSWEAIGSE